MFVIPITLAVGLALVGTFVAFFLRERERGRASGAEHDSILPLAEETPRIVGEPASPRGAPPPSPQSCPTLKSP